MNSKLTLLKETAIQAETLCENLKAEISNLAAAENPDQAYLDTKKKELRAGESQLKKAVSAIEKAEKAEAKEAEKMREKARKVREKAEKASAKEKEKAEKAEEKEKEKAEKAEAKEKARMPEQNAIRMPKPGTQTRKVWDLADELSRKLGSATPIKPLLIAASEAGIIKDTCKTQYSRWRKFHGIVGRIAQIPDSSE